MINRIGREFWTRVIAEYESRAPEQTHWDFAEEWGLKLTTFRSWLYRLRREQDTVPSDNYSVDDELALVPWRGYLCTLGPPSTECTLQRTR